MNAIEICGLSKRYGDIKALQGLDLRVAEGEMIALLGVNGAGKTTAIKLLSCLTAPDEGEAFVCGHSIRTESAAVKAAINVSPQQSAVAKKLSVRENLLLIARLYGKDRRAAEAAVEHLVAQLGLSSVAARRADTLSGGWQRRLSIAMALISEPRVLFLDEPSLGLDVIARHELWSHIASLKGKMTVVLTTHYLEEAEALCDRIAILAGGRLVALGTAKELMALAGVQTLEQAFVKLSLEGVRI